MTTATIDPAISRYVNRCDEHLRDLPGSAREQLRDDITQIVAEVCEELNGAPDDLVGPPLRFVTDLRIAAGFPPPRMAVPPPPPRSPLRELWAHRSVRWTRRLLPELRPAWWVLRGLLLAIGLSWMTGGHGRPRFFAGLVPIWPVFHSGLLFVAAAGAAVYLSVEASRRVLPGSQRALRLGASVVAVAFGIALLGHLRAGIEEQVVYWENPGDVDEAYVPSPEFSPDVVVIGSDYTGHAEEVFDLVHAQALIDQLSLEAAPALVYIEHQGQRFEGGNLDFLEEQLQLLVEEGYLNDASLRDATMGR